MNPSVLPREHLFISERYKTESAIGRGNMRIRSNMQAVSTLMLIILLLCSAIFGAFMAYLLVMSSYYNMPENTTLLIVEDVVFPIFDAGYFNVTILNPSNSASDTNITAIRLTVEGKNQEYNITRAEPLLPFSISIGTEQTFKCKENWSNFTGETVRIEPIAENVSTLGYSSVLPRVELTITPTFDCSQSIQYFDLAVENSEDSIINLTISEIMLFGTNISGSATPELPQILLRNQTETFRCNWNWGNLIGQSITITVKTYEGYEAVYVTDELPGAFLKIEEIIFDYTDVTRFNVTINNLEESTAKATITEQINLTMQDGKTIPINRTIKGSTYGLIPRNRTRSFAFTWNWTEHRNETITVTAYTYEGFSILNETTRIPSEVVWNVTDVKFDLDQTDYFLVNITNMPVSLQSVNITQIKLDEDEVDFEPQVIQIGEEKVYNCTFDWKSLRGDNVNITVLTIAIQTGDELNISRSVAIPSVSLKLPVKPSISESDNVFYVNIVVSNSNNSLQNVTIAKIFVETDTRTYTTEGIGHLLKIGETARISCVWKNTEPYLVASIKVIVYTEEGFQVSRTWHL